MTEYDTSQKSQSHTFFADRKQELEEIVYSCYAPESRLVIGGAQMGKTAILRRVESLLWERFWEGGKSKEDLRLIPIYFKIDYKTAQRDSVKILFGKIFREAKITVYRHLKSSSIREELDKFQPSVDDPQVSPSDVKFVIGLFKKELKEFRMHMRLALNCKIRLVFLLDNAQILTENVRRDFGQFLLDLVNTDSTDTEFLRGDNVFIITCDDEVDKLFPGWDQLRRMPTTKLYAFSGDVGRCEFVVPLLKNRFGEMAQENIEEWIGEIAETICRRAGGHPELLERFVNKVSLEDRNIDASWIQQRDDLDEYVQYLLDNCIQSYDPRARILEILAEEEEPVPITEIYKKVLATRRQVWRHLEALRYHGLAQALDEGYVLAGEIFRHWLLRGTPKAPPESMTRPTVFVSYSHKDENEKDALLSHLGVLASADLIDLWSDDRIGAGADWEAEINQAITKAKVAILLISANFLTSNFILQKEVPELLKRREKEGITIFPVIAKACAWKKVGWLARMNARPKNGNPVWSDGGSHADEDLAAIAEEVADIIS